MFMIINLEWPSFNKNPLLNLARYFVENFTSFDVNSAERIFLLIFFLFNFLHHTFPKPKWVWVFHVTERENHLVSEWSKGIWKSSNLCLWMFDVDSLKFGRKNPCCKEVFPCFQMLKCLFNVTAIMRRSEVMGFCFVFLTFVRHI